MMEAQIIECMERNHVTRVWAIAMLEPPVQFTQEQAQAYYDRMRSEAPRGFSGGWAISLSLSGVPVVAATPQLAEQRAAEIEQDYDLLEESDKLASGNCLEEEVAEMRHP